MNQERRRFVRFKLDEEVFVTEQKEPSKKLNARVKDISAMGLSFESDREFEKGDVLVVEFSVFSEDEPIQLRVEVVWSNELKEGGKFRTGLKILGIEEGSENKFLLYYCNRLMEEYYRRDKEA